MQGHPNRTKPFLFQTCIKEKRVRREAEPEACCCFAFKHAANFPMRFKSLGYTSSSLSTLEYSGARWCLRALGMPGILFGDHYSPMMEMLGLCLCHLDIRKAESVDGITGLKKISSVLNTRFISEVWRAIPSSVEQTSTEHCREREQTSIKCPQGQCGIAFSLNVSLEK